ncbi:MAG: hypothetical protein IT373_14010, partial [Polyangiaceae bacterium]|nr:hypothetical protein [Polyangiaceae bacterium]
MRPFEPSIAGAFYELATERYGSRELRVVSLKGVEQISRPYRFELLVTGPAIDPATLVGDLLG